MFRCNITNTFLNTITVLSTGKDRLDKQYRPQSAASDQSALRKIVNNSTYSKMNLLQFRANKVRSYGVPSFNVNTVPVITRFVIKLQIVITITMRFVLIISLCNFIIKLVAMSISHCYKELNQI